MMHDPNMRVLLFLAGLALIAFAAAVLNRDDGEGL